MYTGIYNYGYYMEHATRDTYSVLFPDMKVALYSFQKNEDTCITPYILDLGQIHSSSYYFMSASKVNNHILLLTSLYNAGQTVQCKSPSAIVDR